MAGSLPPRIRVWYDNPRGPDFLGFDAVVDPIVAAAQEHQIHPFTLSVQSPWGGGKSTDLRLIAARFTKDQTCIVVTTNPWAQHDQDDVTGALMSGAVGVDRCQPGPAEFGERSVGQVRSRVGAPGALVGSSARGRAMLGAGLEVGTHGFDRFFAPSTEGGGDHEADVQCLPGDMQ